MDNAVDDGAVAQPIAGAGLGQQVGRQAHVLHATRDVDVAVARADQAGREHDGLEAGAAHLVDGQSPHLGREAPMDGCLARRRLPGAAGHHTAHQGFIDNGRIDGGTPDRLPDGHRAKAGRRHGG